MAPLATDPSQVSISPYAFAWNDPLGLCPECAFEVMGPTFTVTPSGSSGSLGGMGGFSTISMSGMSNVAGMLPPNPIMTDPNLDLSALEINPDYQGLTVWGLRSLVRNEAPHLEQWQINISAGRALESAYGDFTGLTGGFNRLSYRGENMFNLLMRRLTRPDFIHGTEVRNGVGGVFPFPYGGVVEVKAPQNMLTLQTNTGQLDAEINMAKNAHSFFGRTTAGEMLGASYTLVVPHGALIGRDISETAGNRGVNVYAQYAFINIHTGFIVFSNAERLNYVGTEFGNLGPQNGSIHNAVSLQLRRNTRFWRNTRQNPTNNSPNE